MTDIIALILTVVGGICWGSVGIFGFNPVEWLFGGAESWLCRAVYILVGAAALWCISFFFKENEMLGKKTRI